MFLYASVSYASVDGPYESGGHLTVSSARFVPLSTYTAVAPEEMRRRAREFNDEIQRRRTVRAFDSRPVAREVIEDCLRAAGSAPSGAHMQPWHFVAVADPAIKSVRIPGNTSISRLEESGAGRSGAGDIRRSAPRSAWRGRIT